MERPTLAGLARMTRRDAAPDADPGSAVLAAELSELFERHHLEVFRYLRATGASAEDVADLAAATFERAYAALPGYRTLPSGPRAWLFRIARNLAIDAARRRESAERGLRFWPRREPAPDPALLVVRDEDDRELAARVMALPNAQREAIVLRFAGGLSAREIAAVLGRSEAATHKVMTRAHNSDRAHT